MDTLNPGWLFIASGAAAILPLLAALGTSYVKVSIVFGMLRSALGAQQVPSGMVTMILALALSMFIMSPVFSRSRAALQGSNMSTITAEIAEGNFDSLTPIAAPWRQFMQTHSGQRELAMLERISADPRPAAMPESVEPSFSLLAAAFLLTELKEACVMSCLLLFPFLAVDLIVANILVGLGMFMVSPVIVSLPLKLLLFTAADGWLLLVRSLLYSYTSVSP